ncbi:uncharacterized protein PHACADRAFT_266071 [Phanerochaete carnosa HHB-10118-sp]|uniref:DUF6533 domain-containing protein n=1 Tax=Phanerochaete carnosa (strain HHB-10118-sp) TaxID=650164 RepID=K5VCN7_PHACS|nr:uncharacterized protein PHACADRAFT_266071 [Phanerochaete carnosa HHB-10118-sp]EKM48828.1 hypothetical protein PHACADRAFT_266071 [Phanerochaete carnosa HHB-10118-sp]
MSAQSYQALVQAYSQLATSDYISAAAASLVVYEFLITMGDEINIIWKRPVTATDILFCSVRWCMLLTVALELAPATQNSCAPLEIVSWIVTLVQFFQVALFSALRVFAIGDRSYVWSLTIFALSMVPFVTNLYNIVESKYGSFQDPLAGMTCIQEHMFSARTFNMFMYITRGSLVLADTIVLVLTWIKTFGNWKTTRRLNIKVSLTTCLLRDGTLYFIALLAMNITQLLTDGNSAVRPRHVHGVDS